MSTKDDVILEKDFDLELVSQNHHVISSPFEIGIYSKDGFLGTHCVAASFML